MPHSCVHRRLVAWLISLAVVGPTAVELAHAAAPSTVVLIGDIEAAGALEAARQEMPAMWRMVRLVPASRSAGPLSDESTSLARAYLDADFLRCLTGVQSGSLDVDRLLEKDRRQEAARIVTLAAACALGAGDRPRARELVRRMLVRELEDQATLRQTTPDFQTLVDEERVAVSRLRRVTVEVHTTPDRAGVHVDGVLHCHGSPCRVRLIEGEHLVSAERLGRRHLAVAVELLHDQRLTLTLDEAPAEEVQRQLAALLASGADPTSIEISQASAGAFGAQFLVLVWREQGNVHATAYDGASDKLVAHAAIDWAPDAVPVAVRSVVQKGKETGAAMSVARERIFWLTAAGLALLTGTLVFFANRPVEVQHDIVFR